MRIAETSRDACEVFPGGKYDGKMLQTRRAERWLRQLVPSPDVERDHVGAFLGSAVEQAKRCRLDIRPEAKHAEVECHQRFGRPSAHMNVTDERICRQRNFDTVRRVELLQQLIDI